MRIAPGTALQPMSFVASKKWFKLLAHRSPAAYETKRGARPPSAKEISSLERFFMQKP
jgi:hypothetical protein